MEMIATEHLTKTYRLGVGRARVREMIPPPIDTAIRGLFPGWWSRDTFNALEDVSFAVQRGSSTGIVGHNGAGKTTLLKVIAGVTGPTAGTVRVSGRVAALIDLLVGFNPELTGRENAFLFGAMHGFGREAMAARIENIFQFAEIDELANTPVKRYSAGMSARLGFAVITSLDLDVFMVDEVLAVGDASYQRKCIRWLDEYREKGGTLLFVSHNLGLVRNMTEQVVWLDRGRLVEEGPTKKVLSSYAKSLERRDQEGRWQKRGMRRVMRAHGMDRWGAGGARVHEVHVDQPNGDGDSLRVGITYEAPDIGQARFCIGFVDENGQEVAGTVSPLMSTADPQGAVSWEIDPIPFSSGIYFPIVSILSSDGTVRDRWQLNRAVVVDGNGDGEPSEGLGPVRISGDWSAQS
jgi:homopolymeric O-antigen transport system ATP-binding protein